jgi:nicotinate-nucleotide pyrophosphorylase
VTSLVNDFLAQRRIAVVGVSRTPPGHGANRVGSVNLDAARYCRDNGVDVIAGGCPLMSAPTSDLTHRCMRWVLERTGAVPRGI